MTELRTCLRAVIAELTAELDAFDPFIELATSAGPVSREGPLTHDVLLPALREAPAVGLNVFTHDPAVPFAATCRRWADAWLGGAAPLEALFAAKGAAWHGGVAARDGVLRLKLYATGQLGAVTALLGLDDRDLVAVGVDLTAQGIRRPRRYTLLPGSKPSGDVSHRLLTVLEGADAKRTESTIFLPRAASRELTAMGDESLDLALLEKLEALTAAQGFELRAVAHEVDRFADGRVETDALVAIGAR
jgi:hypothetical protein